MANLLSESCSCLRFLAAGTTYVRRIFITPTRIILRFPELHTQNRILRHFDPDYAVRVSFRDDNLDKLTFAVFSMRTKGTFLEQVVGRHLQLGFIVSGPLSLRVLSINCLQNSNECESIKRSFYSFYPILILSYLSIQLVNDLCSLTNHDVLKMVDRPRSRSDLDYFNL